MILIIIVLVLCALWALIYIFGQLIPIIEELFESRPTATKKEIKEMLNPFFYFFELKRSFDKLKDE